MPAILLVRHAQASFGGADYDVLSERGAEQAAAVHASLADRGLRPDRLVSGSLRRQSDTALPWTSAGAELEVDARWNEYEAADVLGAHSPVAASLERQAGDRAAPMTSRDFQAVLDEALVAWIGAGERSAAAEPWPAFRDRVTAALEELAAGLASGESAVVFTSGGVIAACCVHALGLAGQSLVALNRVAVNGSITKLVTGRRGLTLVSYNEHGHLEPHLLTYR